MKYKSIKLMLGIAFAIPNVAWADVVPCSLFADHMVIQRDTQAPVWGSADAGEEVSVTGSWGDTVTTTADTSGKWMVKLKTPAAGGPHTLTIKGNNTVEIKDVLSGEVWFCSGQSNMEWEMHKLAKVSAKRTTPEHVPTANYVKKEMETASDQLLRQFTVARSKSPQKPLTTLTGSWLDSSPQNNPGFSGTAYFFGRELRKELNVPIGLIKCAWGGTRIEPWMPAEAFQADKEMAAYYQKNQKQASAIFNGMVNPVIPYAIKGAIWYQGESNSGDGIHYLPKLKALVQGWREIWQQPADFPFYFYVVKLAQFHKHTTNPEGGDGFARIRVAQDRIQELPHTGVASAIDIGNGRDIHPQNKQDVGKRLALWALRDVYGKKDITVTGPTYKGIQVEGNTVTISYDHIGAGLMAAKKKDPFQPVVATPEAKLASFAISGADKKWHWADASIDGNTVKLSSAEVAQPVAVRYAYRGNPANANLYNKDGLPAIPFRTDNINP